MTTRRTLIGAGLALAVTALTVGLLFPHHAQAASPKAPKAKKHLLVVTVTKGFRHDSIPVAEQTIQMIGEKTGEWETDFVRTDEDMKVKMTADALKQYDAVVFANTTGVLPLPDPQGFLDYIKAGHGFAAMHSGSDTFHEWPGQKPGEVSAYVDMLGGEFLTHHSQCAIEAHLEDTRHPALNPLAKMPAQANPVSLSARDVRGGSVVEGKTWKIFDEIYLLKNNPRSGVHVLLSLDKYPNDGSPDANKPEDHLISWSKSYGKGRVFYTELGHRQEVWHDPIYQQHVTGGLEFALGLKKGDTTPSKPLTTTAAK